MWGHAKYRDRTLYYESSTNWMRAGAGDIERFEASFSNVAFAPHRHDTYTIGVTLQGVQSFDYRGAARSSLPGNLVILHPDEVHDGRAGTDERFRYRTICIEPASLQDVLQGTPLPFIEGGVSSDPRLLRAVLPLLEDFSRALDPLDYQDALYDLAMILSAICGVRSSNRASSCRANYQAAELARQLIHERLDDGVTLDELETATGHNRWELSRDFRSLYGTSPHRYLTLRRLDRARAMIREGHSLADSACASGFADQSHFTRHFKKTWGLTPIKWAETLKDVAVDGEVSTARTNVL